MLVSLFEMLRSYHVYLFDTRPVDFQWTYPRALLDFHSGILWAVQTRRLDSRSVVHPLVPTLLYGDTSRLVKILLLLHRETFKVMKTPDIQIDQVTLDTLRSKA